MWKMTTSKKNPWKAAYLYRGNKQVAHLGVTPFDNYGELKPQIFARLGENLFRFNLPHLKWKIGASSIYNAIYQAQSKMLHRLDNR